MVRRMIDLQREARDPGYPEDAYAEEHPGEEFDMDMLDDNRAYWSAVGRAKRDAAHAVDVLDRDIRAFGRADRDKARRAKEALSYLNWICSPAALAETWE